MTIELETSDAYTDDPSEFSVPEESEANYLDFGRRKDSPLQQPPRSRWPPRSIAKCFHIDALSTLERARVVSVGRPCMAVA